MNLFGLAITPPDASTFAGPVDLITIVLVVVCGLIALALFGMILVFGILYRSGSRRDRTVRTKGQLSLEWSWTFATFGIFLLIFGWAAVQFIRMHTPPARASEITVVGKQWMWKFQHENGRQELGELHVPVGQPVLLTMTSQDVIHSLYVPAFRIKQDVLPGRYTWVWFQATRPGDYPLYCTQYCGTEHDGMLGRVFVLSQADYQRWLESGIGHSSVQGQATRVEQGRRLYEQLGCIHCHDPGSAVRAPDLHGIYGKPVTLTEGNVVLVDDNYLHESIVNPSVKIVAGYTNLMPPFAAQTSEEDLLNLIAYIKSLSTSENKGTTR